MPLLNQVLERLKQELLRGLDLRLLAWLALVGRHLLLQRVSKLDEVAELEPVLSDRLVVAVNSSSLMANDDRAKLLTKKAEPIFFGELPDFALGSRDGLAPRSFARLKVFT